MDNVYSGIGSVKSRKCIDTYGYIKALLGDLNEDLAYDQWTTLIGILKYEISDESEAFDLFDEFSSKFGSYKSEECHKKFFDSGIVGSGSATIGSLVHWVKEYLGDAYDRTKYEQYFGEGEEVSRVKNLVDRLKKAGDQLPDHILTEEITPVKMPTKFVPAELALFNLLIEGETYATATHPAHESIVDPYNGDELQQYITVNPICKGVLSEKGSYRSQVNVTNFKYAVIEFDTISLDEQYTILNAVTLPYEALVFTGGKSIHAWIRIDAPDLETYKKRTRLIEKMFSDFGYSKKNGKGLDTKVLFDPSSWVRCAGVTRTAIKAGDEHTTGQVQEVLWTEKSKGWDDWYARVYCLYVVASSIRSSELAPKEFEVPQKEHNFSRKLAKVNELLEGEDFLSSLKSIVTSIPVDKLEETLNEAVTSFFQEIRKKSRKKFNLSLSDLYHVFENCLLSSGTLYEGDIRELLLKACYIADKYEENRKAEYKDNLEKKVESIKGHINKWVDPELCKEIERSLDIAEDQGPDEYAEVLRSVEELFEELDFRTAVLKQAELYKYAGKAGSLLSKEFSENKGTEEDLFYVYYNELQTFDRKTTKFDKVTIYTFPSVVTPYICFVGKDQKGRFKAIPLDDNTVSKLLQSSPFLSNFKKVDVISDVPVFHETAEGATLIKGYNEEKKILVVCDKQGYGFMELEQAKHIINDLFTDFKFVSESDRSRAIACLLMPAMCHSGLLKEDYRPLAYIDADEAGAGKGTMVDILTCPYVDAYAIVTQDDTSIGSIDEKIASAIKEGKNHVVLDNLKKTRKMNELSSSFIEAMMTANYISFRCAGERMTELDVRWAMIYVTTNGMPLSRDTAERSLYISIRKQKHDYQYRRYENNLKRWLIDNRPLIMSAIFTILKEYVDRGKPLVKPVEGHRFLYSIPAVNYIITEIFGLPDVSQGMRGRNQQKSDSSADLVRAVCFAVSSEELLGVPLNHLDMFEALSRVGNEEACGLGYMEDMYIDEAGQQLSMDAKRKIGTKLGMAFSKPQIMGKADKHTDAECFIEEFKITRQYNQSTKSPMYVITKEEPK